MSLQANFMELRKRFTTSTFDGAYAIEATCHAPKREGVTQKYSMFANPVKYLHVMEVLTDKYDGKDPHHRLIKKKIAEAMDYPT